MRDFEKDYYNLYFYKICHHTYSRLYKQTNEHLKKIFGSFNFTDKEVLSVMASSDQPFSAYYLGAKTVDTFDIEYLTYYYFYLCKWIFLLYGKTRKDITSKLISECIELAITEEEKNVAAFWKLLSSKFSEIDIQGLFYPQSYESDTPYEGDELRLAKIIKDKSANFHEWDLFKPIESDKQYDIIVTSNILEYISHDEELMQIAAENLNRLLKPDGVIISSNLRGHNYAHRNKFNNYFQYIEGQRVYNEKIEREVPLYYSYRRK